MKFRELPEIPAIWSDFLESRLPLLPASRALPDLLNCAAVLRNRAIDRDGLCRLLASEPELCFERTLENLQRLRQPGSVVVMTHVYPGLFGGPAYQLFKCMTAVKICEELGRRQISAVPVCWINGEPPRAFKKWSVRMLNGESDLCTFRLMLPEAGDPLLGDGITALLDQVEEAGRGAYDPEALEILRSSFCPEITLGKATARLMALLMREWGMIVTDSHSMAGYVPRDCTDALPESVVQCSMLPVVTTVIDPHEVYLFSESGLLLKERDLTKSMAWPQASATIIDLRSQRILERYGLQLNQLYAGEDSIIGESVAALPGNVPEKLRDLKVKTEATIAALEALDPGSGSVARAVISCREKIVYQLDRLKAKFEAACKRKEETIRHRIHRVCNSLAPNGRVQEREIAAIQIPLRYSCAALQSLYERLDILSLEHQLISMD